MKVKAVQAIQVAIVIKAIKEGSMDGGEIASAMLSELVDNYVEGSTDELDVIKELIGEIDDGFLGKMFSIVLDKLAVSKPKTDDIPKQNFEV